MAKFWSFIISAIVISVCIFCAAFKYYSSNVFYFQKYNDVNIIVESKTTKPNNIFITAQNKIFSSNDKKILNASIKGRLDSFTILVKDEKNIKNIIIYNGNKIEYYGDFSALKKEKQHFCYGNICSDYNIYSGSINNKNSMFNTLCAYLFSFFEFNKIFIIPYILIFIALLYYKDNYIDNRFVLFLIILLCFILRINNISRVPVGDECYSIMAVSAELTRIFHDPGNPFFFYLIMKIYSLFFGNTTLSYRILSLLFGFLSIFLIGFLLNKKFNNKTALLAMFLCAINSGMIYYASEIRSYSFQMFLSVILIYLLFETIQKRKNIYFILYTIVGIIAVNTHYYEIIFLFCNFLFALYYFNFKRKRGIAKFFICNLIILLSFIPYFVLTSYKGALLNNSFNNYLDNLSFDLIKKQIIFIFGSVFSFILSIIFSLKIIISKKISKKRKLWVVYMLYSILSVLLFSILLSFMIRPMIAQRYFCLILPHFTIFIALIFTSFKGVKYKLLFLVWIILIQYNPPIQNNRLFFEFEQNIFHILKEVKYKNNVYIILRPTNVHYVQIPNNELDKNIKIKVINIFPKNLIQKRVQDDIDAILKEDKNAIIYTTALNSNKDNIKNENYSCYYNSATDLCLWKIKKH